MKKILLFLCLFIWGIAAQATNGFFSHGIGTKNKGMAGAGVALAKDALSGAINPANFVRLDRRLDFGGTLFMPNRGFKANDDGGGGYPEVEPGQYDSENDFFLIPQFAYNHPLDDKSTIGVVTTMNGMNTEYDAASFQGFGAATKPTGADLYQMSLHVPYSRLITEKLSLGIAPIFGIQAARFRGLEPFGGVSLHPGDVSNNGFDYAFGLGISGGVNYQVNDKLSLGAGMQSKINMTKLDKYRGLLAEEGNLDIPATFQVGVALHMTRKLTLVADYQRIYYSDVPAIANANGIFLTAGSLGSDDGLGMGWKDAKIAKFGIQWAYDKNTVLRVGYSHGNQIIPGGQGLLNVIAPAVGRDHFSVGMTRQLLNGHEFSVSLTHSPKEIVDGTNPNTGSQTGNLQMEQTELEVTYGWRF
ncbi:MAG: outer membrane protein transport protein [Gammaproteobacteria bacterium]|nr:outer membrane protein transport protein [Gammaproteobacteria bacterium]NNJ85143.1 transporter [Gammaproteobacteria bacterium]